MTTPPSFGRLRPHLSSFSSRAFPPKKVGRHLQFFMSSKQTQSKLVDQRTKDVVYGYIRMIQQILFDCSSYFMIPDSIIFICLTFYHFPEYFYSFGNDIIVSKNQRQINAEEYQPQSVFGYNIIYMSDPYEASTYIWRFCVYKCAYIAIGITDMDITA